MDELQQFFKDAVADQLQVLEKLAGPIGAGDPSAIEQARRIVHSLKGSGASYGFPEISAVAAEIGESEDHDLVEGLRSLEKTLAGIIEAAHRRLVLIVDDDPLISRLLEARLTSPERRAVSMASVEAARAFLDQATPDLILMDLFLPDGDGRTLLTDIRSRAELSTIPILVMSAADGLQLRDELTHLGADGIIRKPFQPDEIASQVAALLAGEPSSIVSARTSITSMYAELVAGEVTPVVAAIIPETHGPGGTRTVGADTAVTQHVCAALAGALASDGAVAEWSTGEVVAVGSVEPDEMAAAIDRARLKVRTAPHPVTDGALISLSAAVVTASGRGLNDTYARARRFVEEANRAGGDRVTSVATDPTVQRVLLAEDDTLTAALIMHRLEREGFEVVHRSDGSSALQTAASEDFALVVLDVQMPGISGFEVLERLRKMSDLDDTPIVMLTAVGWERDVVRGFELGANDYILKPFSPAELTARLKRFARS